MSVAAGRQWPKLATVGCRKDGTWYWNWKPLLVLLDLDVPAALEY